MRILFLGDVVGRTGREAVAAALPGLRAALRVDLAIVNAENASHGFGLGPDMATALFAAGADVITLGNHAWDRKEIIPFIAETPRLIRAINFPPGTPGGGCTWTRWIARSAPRSRSWRANVWVSRCRRP
jgi:calcineurin-like phosphoesterase